LKGNGAGLVSVQYVPGRERAGAAILGTIAGGRGDVSQLFTVCHTIGLLLIAVTKDDDGETIGWPCAKPTMNKPSGRETSRNRGLSEFIEVKIRVIIF
jgi:hypothetical protein